MLSAVTLRELLRLELGVSELLDVCDVAVSKSVLFLEASSCFPSTGNNKVDVSFEVFLSPW